MAPELDLAIVKALSLDPAVTRIEAHGGSGFSSTAKIITELDGEEKLYFAKIGNGKSAQTMFAGEHTSLNALHAIIPSLCPQSHAHGPLASNSSSSYFLATDFLNLGKTPSHHSSGGTGLSLAAKIAKLHTTPAPVPAGYDRPQFGFPMTTCCGSTEQINDYVSCWADFFAESRLRAIFRAAEKSQGKDPELGRLVEKTAALVVPRLLQDGHLCPGKGITPVVVHGDLWSGNHGVGSIGMGPVEQVVFDPSSCYAHSEYELGIMRMFGGYGRTFFEEYHKLKPKDEPVEEYEGRMALYELYHYLNHHNIFGGGGFRSSAISIMQKLDRKYGS